MLTLTLTLELGADITKSGSGRRDNTVISVGLEAAYIAEQALKMMT